MPDIDPARLVPLRERTIDAEQSLLRIAPEQVRGSGADEAAVERAERGVELYAVLPASGMATDAVPAPSEGSLNEPPSPESFQFTPSTAGW